MKNQTNEKKGRKQKPVDETENQKFIRVATPRAQIVAKRYLQLIKLARQPMYEITQENATKLIAFVEQYHTEFLARYQPLANGEKKSVSRKIEVEEVF